MNNSNTPAYPQSNDEVVKAFMETEQVAPNGLTKREHFAGLAPDNIPNWFFQVFAESKDNKPEFTWHREATDHDIGECGFTQEGEVAMYFAWRTYYADALLKELSK